MKILILAYGVFLDPGQVAAGNSVRGYFLARSLADYGHQIIYVYPQKLEQATGRSVQCPEKNIQVRSYSDASHLARLFKEEDPGLTLVGYWELLADLPDGLHVPVVLDLVAPRILEVLFQAERDLQQEIQDMLRLFPKADLFLVGNERQRHFLVPWLIMAGFDCRYHVPIDIVPIATMPGSPRQEIMQDTNWRFVSGGVSWPWRRTEVWYDALVEAISQSAKQGSLVLFSGDYIYAAGRNTKHAGQEQKAAVNSIVQTRPLQPYGQMQEYLAHRCHIGIELAERNVEREYSQSFRAIEFLRSGLPIICNDYLEMAGLIQAYDAGWVVHDPSELQELIRFIMDSPEQWAKKSQNALELINSEFHYLEVIRPVAAFVQHPVLPGKYPGLRLAEKTDSAPEEQNPAPERSSRTRTLKEFCISFSGKILQKIRSRNQGESGMIMVSRSDLFPADHGAAVKIDRTAAALSQFVNGVYLLTDSRREYFLYSKGSRQKKKFPSWLSLLAPPRGLVHRRALKKGIPEEDAFLYYPMFDCSYILRTIYLALSYPAQVFQAEFPAFARPCIWGRSLFGGQVVLAEHNVEYQRLQDQSPDLSQQAYDYMRQTEIMLCNQADSVVTVSEQDQKRLMQDGVDARRIHHIPHGIDLDSFDQAEALDVRNRYNIPSEAALLVYHGTYLYPPNMQAVQVMALDILPLLRQYGIQARLLAIGPCPPADPAWSEVIFSGSVEHVAPYLLAADMAVVPLRQGGGTRMKILDYFAASLPVVSTAKGIEGIAVQNGQQAVVVEDADQDFALAVKELLDDPARAVSLGQKGRLFAEQLDWKIIGKRYVQLMGFYSGS